jgi:hypothetical protein
VRAVRLQFKRLCRRIDRQYKQNMQKLDNNTDGLCPVGILLRVAKKLSFLPQSPTAIPTAYVPSVFYRELEKNL